MYLNHFEYFHWSLFLGQENFLQCFLSTYIKFVLFYQQAHYPLTYYPYPYYPLTAFLINALHNCYFFLYFHLSFSFLFSKNSSSLLSVSLIWFSSLRHLFTALIEFLVSYNNFSQKDVTISKINQEKYSCILSMLPPFIGKFMHSSYWVLPNKNEFGCAPNSQSNLRSNAEEKKNESVQNGKGRTSCFFSFFLFSAIIWKVDTLLLI